MDELAWSDALYGKLSEDEVEQLLAASLAEVSNGLRERSDLALALQKVVQRNLDSTTSPPQQWDRLRGAVSALWGDEGLAYMLAWLADDPTPRMAQVVARADADARALLGEITGIFGADIQRTVNMASLLPYDWRVAFWDTLLDKETGAYRIRFRLLRFDDQEVMWESGPDSLFRLMTYISRALIQVGEKEAVSQEVFEEFATDFQTLQALFSNEDQGRHS